MVVSTSNKNHIQNNWGKLKCSPIGPYLQMLGLAPGDANDTSNECKSSEFSSQFNSSMTEHLNVTNKLTSGLSSVTGQIQSIRKVLASIQQSAFNDLSMIAHKIFDLYLKIGKIFVVITKQITNILKIFKASVNTGAAITNLLLQLINLLRYPINGVIGLIKLFSRK